MIFTEDEQRELARRLNPQLRRCATQILGTDATPTNIDDVAQEGWVTLWRALRDFEGGEVVDVWCRAVARNGMRNYLQQWRYALRDLRRVDYVGGAAELDLITGSAEGVEAVAVGYHHGRVLEAVNALPPGYRDYVIRRFWQGYSTTELQQIMSRSVWTRVKPLLTAELSDLVDSVPA